MSGARAGLARDISRDDLINLPIRRYEGPVRLVTGPRELDEARADIAQEAVVGIDTETRPAFHKGESYPPCLLQAATARAVYIFQLRRAETLPVLAGLLGSAQTIKAGISMADDLRQLRQVFAFEESSVLDLGITARRAGLRQTGVRNLAGIVLGIRIPKGARTSNWAAPHLTPQQITYAATDAWVCRELYLRFDALGLLTEKGVASG
jgi:ribonuclease D